MKQKHLFFGLFIVFTFASCGGSESAEKELPLREKYLSEINDFNSEAFVSDQAALAYLKNYCEAAQSGQPSTPDAVDEIVANYCGTPLAVELGVEVTAPPVTTPDFDEELFRKEALERFGVGAVEADGSSLDAMSVGQSICGSNLDIMIGNLGKNFAGSFQEFAIRNLCPEKLPE
jgi:hypothetical protein